MITLAPHSTGGFIDMYIMSGGDPIDITSKY
jgi:hypothetical protein